MVVKHESLSLKIYDDQFGALGSLWSWRTRRRWRGYRRSVPRPETDSIEDRHGFVPGHATPREGVQNSKLAVIYGRGTLIAVESRIAPLLDGGLRLLCGTPPGLAGARPDRAEAPVVWGRDEWKIREAEEAQVAVFYLG